MRTTLAIEITDLTGVGEARRSAVALARQVGMDETETGRIAIIAAEMARNLLTHATGRRQLLLRRLEHEGPEGIELLALDPGPGISNLAEALRDSYSTAGTAGTGLGAILRLATQFDIHSLPGVGTAVLARVWSKAAGEDPGLPLLTVGAVALPKPGQTVSGDSWAVWEQKGRAWLLAVDGLGHGEDAAQAAAKACRTFASHPELPPAEQLQAIHAALRSTRGAAVLVLQLDAGRNEARAAGVGNISGLIIPREDRRRALVSYNGIVGVDARKIEELSYPWSKDSLLVVHTDGLTGHWDLEPYPGLAVKHPSLVAGVLYRDLARGTDDAAVLVAKRAGQ